MPRFLTHSALISFLLLLSSIPLQASDGEEFQKKQIENNPLAGEVSIVGDTAFDMELEPFSDFDAWASAMTLEQLDDQLNGSTERETES